MLVEDIKKPEENAIQVDEIPQVEIIDEPINEVEIIDVPAKKPKKTRRKKPIEVKSTQRKSKKNVDLVLISQTP